MGSPKALLPHRDGTFLEHLLAITIHPRIGAQRVVVGASREEILARIPLPPEIVLMNDDWRKGQLSSIRAAIASLRAIETEAILVALVDHPLITAAVIDALISAFDRSPRSIILPIFSGRRGHPVIFPAHLYDELVAASDEIGARAVVWAHAAEILEVPVDEEGVILDIDDRSTFDRLFPANP